jgi:hypothetical protein
MALALLASRTRAPSKSTTTWDAYRRCASTLSARPVRSPRQMVWSPYSTRSSRARSGRSPAGVGRWTMTRCSSAMCHRPGRGRRRGEGGGGRRPRRWTGCRGRGRRWRAAPRSASASAPQWRWWNQRLDLQVVVGRPGAPAGHRIRADPSSVRPWLIVVSRHGGALPGGPVTPARPARCQRPARAGRSKTTILDGLLGAHGGRAA